MYKINFCFQKNMDDESTSVIDLSWCTVGKDEYIPNLDFYLRS